MELQCPGCGTRFRVEDSLLAPQGRRVRCSRCGTRFWAAPPPSPEESEPTESEEPVPPETEGAAEGEPGQAGAAEGSREEPAATEPEPASPEASPEPPLPGISEAIPKAGGGPNAESLPEGAEGTPPPAQPPAGSSPKGRSPKRGRGLSWLVGLLVLLLVVGLLVELGYAFRNQILAYPGPRAAARVGLEVAGLDWSLPLALRHYRAEEVTAHRVQLASGRQVTLVEGVLHNSAPFVQPLPRLELRVEDSAGGILYREVHLPGSRMELDGKVPMAEMRRRWRRALRDLPEELGPGRRLPFSVLVEDAPPGVERFRVEIVD